jgi:small subunit ribosomal protein S21
LAKVEVKKGFDQEQQKANLEKALKKFKRQVETEGIIKTYRDRMYYKSKGEIRREQAKIAKRKQLRERLKREQFDKMFD